MRSSLGRQFHLWRGDPALTTELLPNEGMDDFTVIDSDSVVVAAVLAVCPVEK